MEARPATCKEVVVAWTEVKVKVLIVVEAWSAPETWSVLEIVDEPAEINPFPTVSIPVVEALVRVVAPVTFRVPVAVIFPDQRFPAIKAPPWTDKVAPGVVVPIPNLPAEVSLICSDSNPLFKTENRRSAVPPLKLAVRREVMAEVLVALFLSSKARKEILEAVLVADPLFARINWSSVAPEFVVAMVVVARDTEEEA